MQEEPALGFGPGVGRSIKRKETENMFFSVFERHGRDSHESKTVPLAEAKS